MESNVVTNRVKRHKRKTRAGLVTAKKANKREKRREREKLTVEKSYDEQGSYKAPFLTERIACKNRQRNKENALNERIQAREQKSTFPFFLSFE